jgi:hypothetical protein
MRRIRLLVAVAATVVAGLLVSAAPASAAPVPSGYAFMNRSGIGQIGYVDIDGVPVVICPQCYQWIDIELDQPADTVMRFNEALLTGVQDLGRAGAQKDPRRRQSYRDAALQAFGAAASAAGRAPLKVGAVGYYDAARGVPVPQDLPWLAAAAQDLAGGVTVLEESPTLPLPPPRAETAMAFFDEAFAELATQQPIGS